MAPASLASSLAIIKMATFTVMMWWLFRSRAPFHSKTSSTVSSSVIASNGQPSRSIRSFIRRPTPSCFGTVRSLLTSERCAMPSS